MPSRSICDGIFYKNPYRYSAFSAAFLQMADAEGATRRVVNYGSTVRLIE